MPLFNTHWGADRKKNVTETIKVFKKDQKLLINMQLPDSVQFMSQNGSGKLIQHVISFWL